MNKQGCINPGSALQCFPYPAICLEAVAMVSWWRNSFDFGGGSNQKSGFLRRCRTYPDMF